MTQRLAHLTSWQFNWLILNSFPVVTDIFQTNQSILNMSTVLRLWQDGGFFRFTLYILLPQGTKNTGKNARIYGLGCKIFQQSIKLSKMGSLTWMQLLFCFFFHGESAFLSLLFATGNATLEHVTAPIVVVGPRVRGRLHWRIVPVTLPSSASPRSPSVDAPSEAWQNRSIWVCLAWTVMTGGCPCLKGELSPKFDLKVVQKRHFWGGGRAKYPARSVPHQRLALFLQSRPRKIREEILWDQQEFLKSFEPQLMKTLRRFQSRQRTK